MLKSPIINCDGDEYNKIPHHPLCDGPLHNALARMYTVSTSLGVTPEQKIRAQKAFKRLKILLKRRGMKIP